MQIFLLCRILSGKKGTISAKHSINRISENFYSCWFIFAAIAKTLIAKPNCLFKKNFYEKDFTNSDLTAYGVFIFMRQYEKI